MFRAELPKFSEARSFLHLLGGSSLVVDGRKLDFQLVLQLSTLSVACTSYRQQFPMRFSTAQNSDSPIFQNARTRNSYCYFCKTLLHRKHSLILPKQRYLMEAQRLHPSASHNCSYRVLRRLITDLRPQPFQVKKQSSHQAWTPVLSAGQ